VSLLSEDSTIEWRLAKAKSIYQPEQQIEAIATSIKFAFTHKTYYQPMYGLGMPGCDAVKQISERQVLPK
jgi:hypothetical protein